MPRVLFVADHDPRYELGQGALYAEGVEQRWIRDPGSALETARRLHPRLVFIDLEDAERARRLTRELRDDRVTRPTAIAVVDRECGEESEGAFDAAGATVVLRHPFEPALWDHRLAELVHVPWRREARMPVRLSVWSRCGSGDVSVEGVALNISARGLLLETPVPLEPGQRADIGFALPGDEEPIEAVGQVVRAVAGEERGHRAGIEFLVLKDRARDRIANFVAEALEAAADATRQGVSPAREGQQWEEELRASEARKAAILDSALDCIVTVDHEGRIHEFNRAAERTFGFTAAQVLGRKRGRQILPSGIMSAIEESFRQLPGREAPSGRGPFETVARHADGSELPVEASISSAYVKGRPLVTAYLRDIRERQRHEAALRASEERLRALFENSSDGLLLLDTERRILYRSPANRRILGYEDDEIVGRRLGSRMDPSDAAAVEEAFERALAHPRTDIPLELRVRHRDGSWRWLEMTLNNLLELPSLGAVVANYRDITPRKEKEEREARLLASLQDSAQQWRQTVDSLEAAVLIVDAHGCVVRANRTARDLAGCSFRELKGRPLESFAGQQPWDGLLAIAGTAPAGRREVLEVRDQRGRLWSLSGRAVAGSEQRQMLLIGRDVTQLTELQEQVRRSELMSAMGSLVAGVAHEVRSPLFSISATIDAWERRHGDRVEVQSFLTTVRRELSRVSRLMNELLDYGRPAPQTPLVPLPLAEAIEPALLAVAEAAENAEVTLAVAVAPDIPKVAMDSRLSQVFRNLLENAIQHSRRGGEVSLEARPGRDGEIEVRIADRGPGFPEGDLERIFDPFFTRRSGGTGLGLSIVRKITHDHGGRVVASRARPGAVMTVFLPASRA